MDPTWSIVIALALNFVLGGVAFRLGAVDLSGLIVGVVIGAAVAVCLGLPGFALLALMFLIGSGATRWGYARKAAAGIAQETGGRRSWVNALGKCSVAVTCAVAAWCDPVESSEILLAFVAALAAATMVTV